MSCGLSSQTGEAAARTTTSSSCCRVEHGFVYRRQTGQEQRQRRWKGKKATKYKERQFPSCSGHASR